MRKRVIQFNAVKLASEVEPWMVEPPSNSKRCDAYRTGRLIHRYEWLLAFFAREGQITREKSEICKEFFDCAVRAANLPTEVRGDVECSFVDPQRDVRNYYEADSNRVEPLQSLWDSLWMSICGAKRILQIYFSHFQRLTFDLGYTVDEGLVSFVSCWVSMSVEGDESLFQWVLPNDASWGAEIESRCLDIGLDKTFLDNLKAVMAPLQSSKGSAPHLVGIIDRMIRNALPELDNPEARAGVGDPAEKNLTDGSKPNSPNPVKPVNTESKHHEKKPAKKRRVHSWDLECLNAFQSRSRYEEGLELKPFIKTWISEHQNEYLDKKPTGLSWTSMYAAIRQHLKIISSKRRPK